MKAVGVYGPHINIPAVTKDALLGPELYAKFLAECRDLVAKGKGDEIKLLAYREGRVIITSAKTFLSYRDIETSRAAVEKSIQQIKIPLLIVYDPADNVQGRGDLIKRETIVTQIKQNAVASPKVDDRGGPVHTREHSVSGSSLHQERDRRHRKNCRVAEEHRAIPGIAAHVSRPTMADAKRYTV